MRYRNLAKTHTWDQSRIMPGRLSRTLLEVDWCEGLCAVRWVRSHGHVLGLHRVRWLGCVFRQAAPRRFSLDWCASPQIGHLVLKVAGDPWSDDRYGREVKDFWLCEGKGRIFERIVDYFNQIEVLRWLRFVLTLYFRIYTGYLHPVLGEGG